MESSMTRSVLLNVFTALSLSCSAFAADANPTLVRLGKYMDPQLGSTYGYKVLSATADAGASTDMATVSLYGCFKGVTGGLFPPKPLRWIPMEANGQVTVAMTNDVTLAFPKLDEELNQVLTDLHGQVPNFCVLQHWVNVTVEIEKLDGSHAKASVQLRRMKDTWYAISPTLFDANIHANAAMGGEFSLRTGAVEINSNEATLRPAK